VAQAFDLAGITNTVGAPSFASFAKGGSWECRRRVGLDYVSTTKSNSTRRVAQAFDLAGIINTVGAPSFASFAKGGSWEC
jgi:hypothetical protein